MSEVIKFPGIADDGYSMFSAPNPKGTPERRLLLAVLERAILDYVGNDPKEIMESEAWLFGTPLNEPASEFSFPWVCEELDLDPVRIMATIKKMPKRGSRRIAPWYFERTLFKDKPFENQEDEPLDDCALAS